jgi:hypothetical protein
VRPEKDESPSAFGRNPVLAMRRGHAETLDRSDCGAGGCYSWVPGTGLNLIPCSLIPTGLADAASMVIAVHTTDVEVAAIAADPWRIRPVFRTAMAPP